MSDTLDRDTAEALRVLVARTIDSIKSTGVSRLPHRTVHRLKMESSTSAAFLPTDELDLSLFLPFVLHEFEVSSDYERVKRALQAHSLIGPHLGMMVGTEEETVLVRIEVILRWFLYEYCRRATSSEAVEQEVLDSCLRALEQAFASDTVNVDFFTVLCNFRMDLGIIELGSDVILEGLSCVAASALWNSDGRVQQLFPMMGFPLDSPFAISGVLRLRKQYSKLVFTGNPPTKKGSATAVQEATDLFTVVISALRLLKWGAVRMGPILKTPNFPFLGGSTSVSSSTGLSRFNDAKYSLLESDIEPLKDVMSALRKASTLSDKAHKALMIGVSRISFASERVSMEDTLLDIMIALEALVLSGVGEAKNRGELRFRLSLYVALLLAKDKVERKRLFDLLKNAYDLRSKVVHGDSLAEPEKAQVAEIADVARRVARVLLDKNAANETVDWLSLALD